MQSPLGLSAAPVSSFRYDINALRAWAVLSVLLYHFGVPPFKGGFSGVDVFFVISGYLMTGIVVSGLHNNTFSVWKFYKARIRRILPALIVVCVAVLMLCWFLLAPDDYVQLAVHVRDSLLFLSNETYRGESGYFDTDAHEKWLLHTWSLSVEWQFYLLLPLVIYLLWRMRKSERFVFGSLLFLAVISLLACIDKTGDSPAKAFYGLKYRYWEMLAGGIVYFVSGMLKVRGRFGAVIFYVGSILIFFSFVYFDAAFAWPGAYAVVPVLGAALILFSAEQDLFINRVWILQWFGDRSYSIYLWHWPVVVLLSYFSKLSMPLWVVAGIVLALLLAEFSYRLVEVPARKAVFWGKDWGAVLLTVLLLLSVVMYAQWVINSKGVLSRVPDDVIAIRAEKNNTNRRGNECVADNQSVPPSCIYGGQNIRAIVLGDSHANTLVTGVAAGLPSDSDGLWYWGHLACPFLKGVSDYPGCSAFNEWALRRMKEVSPEIPLIVISRWSYYALGGNEGKSAGGSGRPPIHFSKEYDRPDPEFLQEFHAVMLDTLCEAATTRKVYVLKPVPELGVSVPQVMARGKMMDRVTRVSMSRADYRQRNAFILSVLDDARHKCGIELLDPLPYLCDNNNCYGDIGGRPAYFDDDHLSEYGNKFLAPLFAKVFQ
jgi:peptidoglycan/LPS O-acetylase OafA/YrhL